MNKQKKNHWINQVLESGKSIKDTEVNPFLFSKIINRLEKKDFLHQPVSPWVSLGMLATVLLLILLNIGLFFNSYTQETTPSSMAIAPEEVYEELVNEYLEDNETDYAILLDQP